MKMKIATAAVVMALAAATGCRKGKSELTFETKPVDRGDIRAKVTATGTVAALVTVQVGSQVSGRILELHADFNSIVKKGDVLVKLDPQLYEAAHQQASANLLSAKANVAKAKAQAKDARRQLERSKQLLAEKLVAPADVDTLQAQADSADAQVVQSQAALEQARAQVHQAEVNLGYTTIHSPIDGIVISRDVDVGQTVAASLQAPTLMTIAEDLKKMQVETSVAEADVGRLKAGQTATFTVDAYPDRRFRGTVRQIRNAATTVQNVVTYAAIIDVDNPDLLLKPGMTANVTFIADERNDVLRIPNAALRFRPPAELLPAQNAEGGSAGPRVARGGGMARGGTASGGPTMASATPNAAPNAAADATGAGEAAAPRQARGEGSAARADGIAAGSARSGRSWQPNNERQIWVMQNGKPSPVTIKTGLTDGTNTEVVEGPLKAGDQVVVDSTGGTTAGPSGASRGGGRPRFGPF